MFGVHKYVIDVGISSFQKMSQYCVWHLTSKFKVTHDVHVQYGIFGSIYPRSLCFVVYNYSLVVTKFEKIYINIATLTFDLDFQGQTSRSQCWYIFLGIPRHRFSTYRHQKQVSTIYTTKLIILNASRHVWPWILMSKVKVTILIYIFWVQRHRFSTYEHQSKFSTL